MLSLPVSTGILLIDGVDLLRGMRRYALHGERYVVVETRSQWRRGAPHALTLTRCPCQGEGMDGLAS
jgi:hypothetical protein